MGLRLSDTRRGPAASADFLDQGILAGAASGRPEVDGLVLPGGVERREVVGVGIGLGQ